MRLFSNTNTEFQIQCNNKIKDTVIKMVLAGPEKKKKKKKKYWNLERKTEVEVKTI